MSSMFPVSRRRFFGGVATAMGALTLKPDLRLFAQAAQQGRQQRTVDEYDALAKLANNENPYGPPESVLKAMTDAFKYANRYGYPDGGITEAIAKHHDVDPDNVMLGAGSGEILDIACVALLQGDKKVVGVDPSYDVLYQHARTLKADQIRIPLLKDYTQDIPAMIRAVKQNYRDVGFVYLVNPNNPTGRTVSKKDVALLLDSIPEDVPVLIDEAYHHFVEDPEYATSVPYVKAGRNVIIARTFSKIAALAGMRLGYALAPRSVLQQLRPFGTGTINAVVKWGGVAALKDTASQAWVKKVTIEERTKAVRGLNEMGFETIPSECNFFMVNLKKPVASVTEEFRKRKVLVGRPFPPLLEHMRVSIGTPDEMNRFMVAFREIFANGKAASGG
jgi:histidinol-phosphate aminotransferase